MIAFILKIDFHSWHTPLALTLAVWAIFALVFAKEMRESGSWSIPLFSFMAFIMALSVTVSSWVVYFIVR